jgi:D-amino-acid oxidase
MTERPDVAIVGAGVIGLTLGVCLAERGLAVHLYAREAPAQTTSAVASAMVGPVFDPADASGRIGVTEFTALAGQPGTGVALRRGRLASREAGPPPPGFDPCGPAALPGGFASGFWATVPLVDMPVYLGYLTSRLTAAGAQIISREIGSLAGLCALAPLAANCSGLGARELVPDATLTAVRGQHVVVSNPGLAEFFISDPAGPEWTAWWPYPDHVLLGGIRASGDERTEPDPTVAEAILRRCVAAEARLAGAEVIGHQTGLRPVRPAVRLDAEMVNGTRLVHSYGHGGTGITQSWGCAYRAADLLLGPVSPGPPPPR